MDAEFAKGGGTGWEPVLKVRQGKSGGSHGLFIDEPGKIDPWLRPGGLQPQRSVVMGLGTVRHVDAVAESDAAKAPCTAAARLDADMPGWQALAAGEQSLTVPANTRRRVIFDLGRYSCAYPLLVTRGGKGTVIAWNWLESLYLDADPNSGLKGDRGSVEDKFFRCKQRFQPDVFRPGGSGVGEHFSIPWWRAGRYAQLTVATAAEPVTLVRLAVEETGYPLNDQGAFDCSDSALLAVLPLCQRTLETCCHETYMDCPYYEQQQWVGDTRVQALIGYALTLDDAPQRKVISLLGGAQVADGWVPAFYPVRQRLSIPSFTLTWIGMLTDYAWWRGNADFVRAQMPSVRRALDVFCAQRDPDGLLRLPPGWHFVDWVRDSAWQGGGPPPHGTTPGALLQWWAVYALREVARVESWLGEPELAARWQRLADELAVTVMRLFWRAEHGLFSEDTAGHHFCEHTQALAVLAGATLPAGFGATLLARRDLAQVGLFFTHYLFEAYARLGLADALWQRLDPWRGLAGLGLLTVPETIEPTRSDTHAWSAHPLYHARVSLLGIRPAALGFERVRIAPQPGSSAWLAGAVPHPKGLIQVSVREGNVKVSLPPGLAGELIWAGKTYPLSPGDFST